VKSKRTLRLSKETLADLTADDMRLLAAGSPPPTYYTCLTDCGICDVVLPATLRCEYEIPTIHHGGLAC
jgi:hypothetical protein